MCWIDNVRDVAFVDLFCSLSKHHPPDAEPPRGLLRGQPAFDFEAGCDFGTVTPAAVGMAGSRLEAALGDVAWTRAVFFRDPLDRFLSAYLSFCHDAIQVSEPDPDDPDSAAGSSSDLDPDSWCYHVFGEDFPLFEDVVAKLRSRDGQDFPDSDSAHNQWRRQSSFCGGVGAHSLKSPAESYDVVAQLERDSAPQMVGAMLQRVGIEPANEPGFRYHFLRPSTVAGAANGECDPPSPHPTPPPLPFTLHPFTLFSSPLQRLGLTRSAGASSRPPP